MTTDLGHVRLSGGEIAHHLAEPEVVFRGRGTVTCVGAKSGSSSRRR
jgi:hypothetical protein